MISHLGRQHRWGLVARSHGFLSLIYAWKTDYSILDWLALILPYKIYYTKGAFNFIGWVRLFGFAGFWAFSLPIVQQKLYEVFLVLNWVWIFIFLLDSNLHDYNTLFFVQPAIVLMVADYMLRRHVKLEESFSSTPQESSTSVAYASIRVHPKHQGHEGLIAISSYEFLAVFTLLIPDSWPKNH